MSENIKYKDPINGTYIYLGNKAPVLPPAITAANIGVVAELVVSALSHLGYLREDIAASDLVALMLADVDGRA